MENGNPDLGLYLSFNQYYILFLNASHRTVESIIENPFSDNPTCSANGNTARHFTKKI